MVERFAATPDQSAVTAQLSEQKIEDIEGARSVRGQALSMKPLSGIAGRCVRVAKSAPLIGFSVVAFAGRPDGLRQALVVKPLRNAKPRRYGSKYGIMR